VSVISCESCFPDGHDRTSHQEPNDTKDTDRSQRSETGTASKGKERQYDRPNGGTQPQTQEIRRDRGASLAAEWLAGWQADPETFPSYPDDPRYLDE
jgi:outer membrane biosynthesis protein TonB